MKSENITSGRLKKISSSWIQGVNSLRNPWGLPENQFKWGVNITARGGVVQTRPGYKMQLSLPPGNFQGGILFSANKQKETAITQDRDGVVTTIPAKIFDVNGNGVVADELSYMLFAVNGKVYYSPFPLVQPSNWEDYRLKNISMNPDVDQFVFALATRSANLSTGSDEFATPAHRIVMIQDGISFPAYWDGSDTNGVQTSDIPVGYWLAFSGNRMWISDKNIVFASDLGDPTSFKERLSGTSRGDFSFSRPITGMVSYVGQDTSTRLIVFTDRSTFQIKSGVLDRDQWVTTENFQSTLYPTVGCVAGKSISFQAGQMWWYSQGGLITADPAATAYLSSQVLYKDVEMVRAKRLMSGDPTKICAIGFENYLLCSIPYMQTLNSDTMVLDYAAASEWGEDRNPAWAGVWTGTRPVEWTSGVVDGQSRCFHFSVDYAATNDGSYNHLWEAFQPQRVDTYLQINPDKTTTDLYNRIYAQFESPLLGDEMDLKQFVYAEIESMQVGGTVDLKVSYKGSKGRYNSILEKRILAITDDYQWKNTPYESEIEKLGMLNNQYRRLITESAQRNSLVSTCESKLTDDVDKAFSLLIEWCGEFGVEIIRLFMDPWSEKSTGAPQGDETKSCVVSQGGDTMTLDLLPNPYEKQSPNDKAWSAKVFKTVTLNCNLDPLKSISATASASFLSYISFEHAQEEAGVLALQAATAAAQQFKANNPC
jgi:hypothetical protein